MTGEEPLAGEVGAACPELVLALVSGAALTAEERGRLALADDAGGLVLLDAQGGLLLQFPPPLPTLEEFREALAALPGTAAAPPPARKASPD